MSSYSDAYNEFKNRKTPVPTPAEIRLISAALVGVSVAVLTSTISFGIAAVTALVSVIIAVVVPLAHPYRKKLRAYADEHGVTMVPSVGQLVPLMLWWVLLMLAVVLSLPNWGVLLIWLACFGLAWVIFPHVDGTRKMAYAD